MCVFGGARAGGLEPGMGGCAGDGIAVFRRTFSRPNWRCISFRSSPCLMALICMDYGRTAAGGDGGGEGSVRVA